MRTKFDTTADRFKNHLNPSMLSMISNNRILKKLLEYNVPISKYAKVPDKKHNIEFIPCNEWAEWRIKHSLV